MKQIPSLMLAGFLAIILVAAGCKPSAPEAKFTLANFDKVTVGMSKADVEKILGPPAKTESKQLLVFGGEAQWQPVTTARYEDGEKFAEITYKDDKVEKKNTNITK